MSKSFNELMNEASHGRTECALLINFTRTFNDYELYNLEIELNNQPKLCAHFDKYVGDRISSYTNLIYWDNESQSIPIENYAMDLDLIDLPIDDFTLMDVYNAS